MEPITTCAKHSTPNTRWTRALKKLIRLRDTKGNSDAYMMRHSRHISLNRGDEYALAEILKAAGCPKHPGDGRSKDYAEAMNSHIPVLYSVMVLDFETDLRNENFEICLDAIAWGYRQEIPRSLIDELEYICNQPPRWQ